MKSAKLPYQKTFIVTILLLSVSLVFSACSSAKAQGRGTPSTPNSQNPLPQEPGLSPATPTEVTGGVGRLTPDSILLELTFEPSFARIENSYVYGRPPVFVLLADGRVIYTQEGASYEDEQIMMVKLSAQDTSALLKQVRDLGFDNLESHTDFCITEASGEQRCAADAGYTILRMRTASDGLKEVKIYADFANDPAAFTSIRDLLGSYTHPDATPYIPSQAALFLSQDMDETRAGVKEWPLDPALLQFQMPDMGVWSITLDGPALTKYLASAERNVGDSFFKADGAVYRAYLVPWLPGEDYSAQLQSDFSAK